MISLYQFFVLLQLCTERWQEFDIKGELLQSSVDGAESLPVIFARSGALPGLLWSIMSIVALGHIKPWWHSYFGSCPRRCTLLQRRHRSRLYLCCFNVVIYILNSWYVASDSAPFRYWLLLNWSQMIVVAEGEWLLARSCFMIWADIACRLPRSTKLDQERGWQCHLHVSRSTVDIHKTGDCRCLETWHIELDAFLDKAVAVCFPILDTALAVKRSMSNDILLRQHAYLFSCHLEDSWYGCTSKTHSIIRVHDCFFCASIAQ